MSLLEAAWWDGHTEPVDIWGTADPAEWLRGTEDCLELLERWLPPFLQSSLILDLGCGVGRLTLPFARAHPAATLLGVDVSQTMLQKALGAQRALEIPNVHWVLGDGRTLPDGLGPIGAAFSVLMFQHLPPDAVRGYIAAVARLLVRDGRFLVQHVTTDHESGFLSYSYSVEQMQQWGHDFQLEWLQSEPALDENWTWTLWRHR